MMNWGWIYMMQYTYMCDDLDSQERAGRVVELLEECVGMAGA